LPYFNGVPVSFYSLSPDFNPNYSLEAKRANELVGFTPDLEKLE